MVARKRFRRPETTGVAGKQKLLERERERERERYGDSEMNCVRVSVCVYIRAYLVYNQISCITIASRLVRIFHKAS